MKLRKATTATSPGKVSESGATIRWLGLLFLPALILLAAACGDNGGQGDATPTPTIQADETATPPPQDPTETPGDEGFRDFIPLLEDALDLGDLVFLSNRALTEPVVCTAEDLAPGGLGGPSCEFEGQSFDGFPIGFWRSEGAIVPVEEAFSEFDTVFSTSLPDESDDFGDGSVQVYALNVGEDAFDAIVTAIIERPEDFAGEGPLRVAIGTSWSFEEDSWMLTDSLAAFVLAEDLLTPVEEVTAGLYPNWERYERP